VRAPLNTEAHKEDKPFFKRVYFNEVYVLGQALKGYPIYVKEMASEMNKSRRSVLTIVNKLISRNGLERVGRPRCPFQFYDSEFILPRITKESMRLLNRYILKFCLTGKKWLRGTLYLKLVSLPPDSSRLCYQRSMSFGLSSRALRSDFCSFDLERLFLWWRDVFWVEFRGCSRGVFLDSYIELEDFFRCMNVSYFDEFSEDSFSDLKTTSNEIEEQFYFTKISGRMM